jgi:hypothetical protein
MARGRMINQSIALDAEFNAMSVEAQLLYMRTIPHLDRDGLILGNPVALWAKIAPLMPDLMPRMSMAIREWSNAGLVIAYDTKQGTILFFQGFSKNQTGMRYDREAESVFPPPPGYHRNGNGIEKDKDDTSGNNTPPAPPPSPDNGPLSGQTESGATPDELRHGSGVTPPEVKLNKVEVEVKGSEPEHRRTTTTTTEPLTAKFVREYERVWGLTLTSYHAEQLNEWVGRVTFEGWSYALQECAKTRNIGQWKYFEKILARIEKEGMAGSVPIEAKAVTGVVNINLAAV